MAYTIAITDERQRDAQISAYAPARARRARQRTADGRRPRLVRLIKATEHTAYEALLRAHGDDPDRLSEALVAGDPEVPLEQAGSPLGAAARVHLKPDGGLLYAARVLRVVYDSDGQEVSRDDFVDVEATVGEDAPALPWSGRLIPLADAVRRFAFVRKLQLRHVNGLTFDFLHEIAATLQSAGKLLVVGSGRKGQQPLIFTRNGSPYRGFLEGRIDGDGYRLVLHLSNLELKRPAAKEA